MPFITKLGSVAARAYGWLAAVAQAVVSSDAYFYLVSILLPGNGTNGATNNTFLDSSTNNFTVTRNGNTTQGTFTPFSQTGWSNYFDGSGDYLAIAPTSITISGDFTWEAWVYEQPINAYGTILGWRSGSTSWQGFLIQRDNGTNNLAANITQGGVVITQTSGTYIRNKWNHVALVRSGATITLYVNGFSAGATTYASSISPGTSCWIGSDPFNNVAAVQFSGWVSNCRFVNGTALYTATFTPSAVPLTAIANTLFLVCQSNRFVDNSANNFTITRNGDVAVTANSPFAPNNITPTSYSARINGASDYLSVPANTAFAFGTGNFTIEAWIYDSGTTANFAQICGASTFGVANDYLVAVDGATKKVFVQLGASGGYTSTGTYFSNTWVHLAVVRSGTTVTIYADGISIGSFTSSNSVASTIVTTIGAASNAAAGSRFLGAISNLRIVKGTAVYTSNFTPPTAPLTAISGTSLLTCQNATFIDNSTNAFAITVSGNTQPITTNPFQAPTPSPVSYSGQFDGTGDYLTAPDNAALDMGASDFTIELWFYPSTTPNNGLFGKRPSTATFGGVTIYFSGSTTAGLLATVSGSTWEINVASSVPVVVSAWNHIAVTRSGNTWRLFINGAVGSTSTLAGTIPDNASAFAVGAAASDGGLPISAGLISNFRVVKGTAVYTAAFTPPTAPLTAISGTSLLTCQNNRFIDNSSNAFAITVNGDTRPVINSPFGYQTPISSTAYSGYFDGSGDYLTTPSNAALGMGAGDFTIEAWVYTTSTATQTITSAPTNNFEFLLVNSGSNTYLNFYDGVADRTSGTNYVRQNVWQHVAVTRSGTTLRLFIDGVVVGTHTVSTTLPTTTSIYIARAGAAAINYLFGVLSNLRIVKGTAVYTAAFTPPTSPLTAIANTSLLTCQNSTFIDNSTNAFTITVNGNATTTSVNPFGYSFPAAPTPVSYSALTNGGSGYFDGSGDFLTVPANTALNLSSGDFTIEGWFYCTGITASSQRVIDKDGINGVTNSSYMIFINSSAVLVLSLGDGTSAGAATNYSGSAIVVNQWTHFAATKSGTTIRLFQNGVLTNTSTQGAAITDGGKPLYIAQVASGIDATAFRGFISNVRIVKGTAVYTSAFTPPPAPVTAITNTSLLLNYTNAGIADAASQNVLETVGNAQISTAQSKWGGGSMAFDGTGDWLLIPHQPPQFLSTGNFTIEMWVYRNSSGTYGLVGKGTATTGWLVSLNSSNQVVFTYGSSTITSTGTVAATTWAFITVVREGTGANQTKIYINGTNDGTGTVSTDFNQTNVMYVGADRTGGSNFNGYIDDLRITKFARYTANFTPPTAAFSTQ